MNASILFPPWFRLLSVGALFVALCGCAPTEVISWSPNGKRAVVAGSDGIYLTNENGAISGKLPDAHLALPTWLPDSHRMAGVRAAPVHDWNEYASVLGPERAHAIAVAAAELLPLIKELHGDWKDWENEPPIKQWAAEHASRVELEPAVYWLTQFHPEAVVPELKAWSEAQTSKGMICELFIRDPDAPAPASDRVLVRSADFITSVRPSPNGAVLAFELGSTAGDSAAGQVVSVDGGTPVEVENGVMASAWTADGRALVYAESSTRYENSASGWVIGTIGRRPICDEKGRMMAGPGEKEVFASIAMNSSSSTIASLPDGRIMFAAPDVHLPAMEKDQPKQLTFFLLRPGDPASLDHLVDAAGQKRLSEGADWFVVNPAGTLVAIPGNDGELSIVSLATREITVLQEKAPSSGEAKPDEKTKLKDVAPSWRTDDEICYMIPPGAAEGSPKRAELVLQKIGGPRRAISKSWPDEMVKDFLLPAEKPDQKK